MQGATRGIGQSMALALARAGADIVLIQRSMENLTTRDEIRKLGRKAEIVVADLADGSAIKGAVKQITQDMGLYLDILVNCGGIQRRYALLSRSCWSTTR